MRRGVAVASQARLIIRVSDGPILPATPRIIKSPSSFANVPITPDVGSLGKSSSCSTFWMNSRATAKLRLLRVAVEVDRIGPLRLFHFFAKRADERDATKRPLNRPVHLSVSRRTENPR